MAQDARKHRRCQASGLRVLLAGVIGREQTGKTWRENEARSVLEPVSGARWNQSLSLQKIEIGVERDASEGKNRARVDELQFPFEIGQTIADFFRQRLVVRRRAANRRGNQRALEEKPVIGAFGVRLICEAGAMELRVQEIARTVSCEHSTGAVRAMRGGCEPDDDEIGFWIAKGRHGTAPIGPITIGAPFGNGDFFAVTHQARTFTAGSDFTPERSKLVLWHCASNVNLEPLC